MMSLGLPLVASVVLFAAAEQPELPPSEAVQSGQQALDHWGRYPWYDAKSDDLEPLDLSPPWWERWFPDWNGSAPSMGRLPENLLQWVAWILIALLLVVLAFVAIRTYRTRRRGAGDAAAATGAGSDAAEDRRRVEALPWPVARRQGDLLAEAEEQYRLGHYGQAIVYLFSYQLVQLDRHQQIRLAHGKTNRQYLRELGTHAPLRRLLEQTMVVFEDAFFGHHVIDQNRFESCWCRLREFESLATEGRR